MALVQETRDKAVAILTLNRPERRNALSVGLLSALSEALVRADADNSVRAIVIAANGEAFCAGGDLADGMMGQGSLVDGERARSAFVDILRMMPRLGTPIIAAVTGAALGGGLGLVAAVDFAVVDPDAKLGTPEIHVGLFPFVITAALQRCMPHKALLEMAMLGTRLSAAQAVAYGIATRVSAPGSALAEALALAHQLSERSAATLALGKRAFYLARDMPYEQALDTLNDRLSLNLQLEDAAEGLSAFVERRAPAWRHR